MTIEPVNSLELRALEQRNRLHQTAIELKSEIQTKIDDAREKLGIRKNLSEHFTGPAILVGAVALLCGYGIAGVFTQR
ncbi:MAG: hypothetical protein WA824_17320 [Candidatus Sulfotelmatobacter sp.]